MSALPPKADIRQRIEHVCSMPEADIAGAHGVGLLVATLKVIWFGHRQLPPQQKNEGQEKRDPSEL